MAIHIKDDLSKIIEIDIVSDRINSFLWISIAAINPNFTDLNPDSTDHRKLMADHLNNDQNTAHNVRFAIKNCLIPDPYLKWIDNSRRQALWIEQYIVSTIKQLSPLINNHISSNFETSLLGKRGVSIPFHLHGKNRSTALFDYWISRNYSRMQDGIEQSKSMQIAWQNFIKADKFFAWLDAEDAEKKRTSFWAWLELRDKTITQNQPQFQNHEELLIFFDNPRFVQSDKEVFSKNYRKIWNQQKNREELNGRKQCNFVLPEKTISNLKMLAQKHGLTRTEIIELIIDSEAKDEIYISERLRRINSLKSSM